MDNDFNVDLQDILSSLAGSDVVVMRFVTLGQRLLFDFRNNDVDGPLIRVVEAVTSVEERYRELQRIRPRFPLPERIVAIWWPRFARSLHGSPAWNEVMGRVSDSGYVEAVRSAGAALDELVSLERKAERDAVRGEGFRTLWSAPARLR